MPLSRFTQTWPLDFADAIALSEAAPVAAALLALGAGELGAIEFDDVLAGALEDFAGAAAGALDGTGTGVEPPVVAGAAMVSVAVDFFE